MIVDNAAPVAKAIAKFSSNLTKSMVSLNRLRTKTMEELIEEAKGKKDIYMIHPDSKGCIFLQKVNGKYRCKIYNFRPRACQGFRCSLSDHSMEQLLFKDAIFLLGEDQFGRKFETRE